MSVIVRNFYHNLREPVIICDLKLGVFYQNKASKNVFKIDTKNNSIKTLTKIGYKFRFDFCILNSENINTSPFDELVASKFSYSTYGIYQESERKFLYFLINAFNFKQYRIIYFYDLTRELESEKLIEENEKLKIQNQEFSNTNSLVQNQALKMGLLNRVSISLSKTLDLNTMISSALKELSIIFGAKKLYFAKRINENEFEIEYTYPEKLTIKDKTFFYNKNIIEELNHGKNHIITSIKEHDKSDSPFKTQYTRIIMPVINQNGLSNIIIIFTPKKDVTSIEKELLVSISMQISNAFISASLFREITKQKEELQSALTELKETQLQLINSEKMASLGQLIASVAHEINTPLASISSNNEILLKLFKGKIDSNLFEIFEDINSVDFEAIKRINGLVQSLKRFVRLDETVVQKANINKELDLTLEILRHKTKKGISIVKNYNSVDEIECYPNMLNQVFLNILMNAIQSIEKKKEKEIEGYKGEIEITTKEKDNFLVIEITDNGLGISEENKKKIFQAGFTTKKIGEGTGLGLAICKKIIEKHKGEISFDSKNFKGMGYKTVFSISIPKKSN